MKKGFQEKKYLEEFLCVPGYEDRFFIKNEMDSFNYSGATFAEKECIPFGRCVQNKRDVLDPLEWIVLSKKDDQLLLLAKKGISCKEFDYFGYYIGTSWGESGIREWLNSLFFDTIFNQEEKRAMLKCDHSEFGDENNSKTYVFLLSDDQIKKYLSQEEEQCFLTPLAAAQNPDYLETDLNTPCSWWINKLGSKQNKVCICGATMSEADCTDSNIAVRPAIVVDLNNVLFGGKYESTNIRREEEYKESINLLKQQYKGRIPARSYKELKAENPEMISFFNCLESGYFEKCPLPNSISINHLMIEENLIYSRRKENFYQLIAALKEKYANANKCKTLLELINENKEKNTEIQILKKDCVSIFDTDISDLLRKEGILQSHQEIMNSKADKKAEEKAVKAEKNKELRKTYHNRVVEKLPIEDPKTQSKLDRLFERLEVYYPEHAVFALDAINQGIREDSTALAKSIGYKDYYDMFKAYGWRTLQGEEVKEIRNTVIYTPGNEPDFIKTRVNNTVENLGAYFPSHIIDGSIQNEHSNIASTISGLYQWFGYDSIGDFLKAYGFEYRVKAAGRPSTVDPAAIIAQIRENNDNMPYHSMNELKEKNKELSGKIKTLGNKSMEYFGMPLKKYLIKEKIIKKQTDI